MKKLKFTLSKSLIALGVAILSAVPAWAETPRTVIVNPGEDATTSARINWHSDLNGPDTYCFLTTADDSDWSEVQRIEPTREECTVYDNMYSKTSDGKDFYESAHFTRNVVSLEKLQPGTRYMYRVGEKADGEIRYFSTLPDNGTWTAAIISDFHSYTPIPSRKKAAMSMLDKLKSVNGSDFDMILHIGDIIAWGGSYSFWQDLYNEPYFRNYMWAGVNGNHDNMDRTNNFNGNQFFKNANANPLNGYEGQEGVCYYTKLGDLLLITLNSEAMRTPEGLTEAQNWVKEVIADNPSKYIAVMEHYQWFYGEQGSTSQFSRWNELFDKYEVDLALGANNHIYVATNPIKDGKVTEAGKGTVYIQTPSSDNDRGSSAKELTDNTDLIKSRWTEGAMTVGALLMKVTPENIEISLYNRNGEQIDKNVILPRIPDETPAKVESVNLDNLDAVSPRQPLDITFTRRMDRTSVEKALTIDNNGKVSFQWKNDYTLRVDLSNLIPQQTYTLTINGSIAKNSQTNQFLDGDGDGMEGGNYVLTFTMTEPDTEAPYIVNTTPDTDGEALFTNRPVIGIEFNEEIIWDEKANADFVTVTDRDGNIYPGHLTHDIANGQSFLQYYLDADLPCDRAFLVSIKPGITDTSGNVADAMYFRFLSEYRQLQSYTTVLDLNTLSDFWAPDQSGSTQGIISSQSGISSSDLVSSTDPSNTGSIELTYAFDPDASKWVIREYWSKSKSKTFSDISAVLTAWVYGDGSNNNLCMLIRANSTSGGLIHRDPMQPINWRGWRLIHFDLANDPIVHYTGDDTLTSGWLFDSFYMKHENTDPDSSETPFQQWSGIINFDELGYSHWDAAGVSRQASIDDIDLPSSGMATISNPQGLIKLYDNTIHVITNSSINHVTVYTLTGAIVAQSQTSTVDVSHLQSGVYVTITNTANGSITAKVLKH